MKINKVNPRRTLMTALKLSRAMKLAKLRKNKITDTKHKTITKTDHKHLPREKSDLKPQRAS